MINSYRLSHKDIYKKKNKIKLTIKTYYYLLLLFKIYVLEAPLCLTVGVGEINKLGRLMAFHDLCTKSSVVIKNYAMARIVGDLWRAVSVVGGVVVGVGATRACAGAGSG